MWLIAETTQGVYLEFWKDGAAVVSLEPTPAMAIAQLELVRAQFNNLNLIPRAVDGLRCSISFNRETQD
jgi:hypothetical protein